MQFEFESAGLGVSCRNWSGPFPESLRPFKGRSPSRCTVDFQPEQPEVAVDRESRTIRVRDGDLTRAVIAGLCLATAERADMLAIHAAACVQKGAALLLLAPPEGGKSTLSTLMSQATLLSDELVILRREGTRTFAHGTPVRSDCPREPSPGSAPLAAMLFLRKAPEERLEPISAGEALEEFLAQAWAAPGLAGAQVLERARLLLEGVPCYRFHFRNHPACVAALDPLLAARPRP